LASIADAPLLHQERRLLAVGLLSPVEHLGNQPR
jgi:hypothetical protein